MRRVSIPLMLSGSANLLACAHGLGYFALLGGVEFGDLRHLLGWAAVMLAVIYALVWPPLIWWVLPIGRALAGSTAELDVARRRVLGLPLMLSRVTVATWLFGAASFVPYNRLTHVAYGLLPTVHVVIGTVLVGAVSSTFVFYLEEWWMRRRAIPVLFPDGKLNAIPGVKPVPIAFKILVLLAVSVLLPVGVLTFAGIAGTLTPQVVLYLGFSFFLMGGLQAFLIARSVNKPVQALAGEMKRVSRGDLDAHAEVVSVDDIGQLAEGFNEMVAGLRKARFVQDTFGRYVARQVLEEILNGKIHLGGELRRATVLFSDIRGFTSLSEKLPPEEVVRLLNRYLDIMVDVLVDEGATIDKFIGDGIMASFGVPLSQGDDALHAVRAALTMISRLETWNVERARAGEPTIQVGIGLHTGEVVAGNIGSAKKMEYTVIGDTVNTSSRIEQLNKELGTRLLVSAETYAMVAEHVVAEQRGPISVKGKQKPIEVYEVTALKPRA